VNEWETRVRSVRCFGLFFRPKRRLDGAGSFMLEVGEDKYDVRFRERNRLGRTWMRHVALVIERASLSTRSFPRPASSPQHPGLSL